MKRSTRRTSIVAIMMASMCASCGSAHSSDPTPSQPAPQPTRSQSAPQTLQHILFVGDSFTHGRYLPVRHYDNGGTGGATAGSSLVVDENYGQTGVRAEKIETGPLGGIPGIFARFAVEAGLNYVVHIEAISETSLTDNYKAASSVIDQAQWNDVVLQELSSRPLPRSLTNDPTSNPSNFCSTVQTIERGVHGAAPSARVFLYETWPRGDLAQQLSGSTSSLNFTQSYLQNLGALGAAYHDVYDRAAVLDGHIQAVAPAGEAWQRAWAQNVANPDPFTAQNNGPLLWYGINATNDPSITQPDYLHPSIHGAYLSALVLFEQISGVDPRTLGASEQAAATLGISPAMATTLQNIAWQTVQSANPAPQTSVQDPCAAT
jgi:hypothetical protein